jgi:hypothetical protein
MGWLRVTFPNKSTPDWALALNADAETLDPLSPACLKPPTMLPPTQAELDAIDRQGA